MSTMDELLSRLDSMTPDEVSAIFKKALDELGIAYTVGEGAVGFEEIFPGLEYENDDGNVLLTRSASVIDVPYCNNEWAHTTIDIVITKPTALTYQVVSNNEFEYVSALTAA